MAISIAYGIAFATVLTLLLLPLFLSFSNRAKVTAKWLKTGDDITKEEVERAIKEQKEEEHMLEAPKPMLNGSSQKQLGGAAKGNVTPADTNLKKPE